MLEWNRVRKEHHYSNQSQICAELRMWLKWCLSYLADSRNSCVAHQLLQDYIFVFLVVKGGGGGRWWSFLAFYRYIKFLQWEVIEFWNAIVTACADHMHGCVICKTNQLLQCFENAASLPLTSKFWKKPVHNKYGPEAETPGTCCTWGNYGCLQNGSEMKL